MGKKLAIIGLSAGLLGGGAAGLAFTGTTGIAGAQDATSTTVGDAVEVKAIRLVFKSRADKLAVNATKSLVGHTLGAAGSLAGVVSALTLTSGQVHPTLNLDDPDPACALAGLSKDQQTRKAKVALINAFGFGSNNAAVVLKALSS